MMAHTLFFFYMLYSYRIGVMGFQATGINFQQQPMLDPFKISCNRRISERYNDYGGKIIERPSLENSRPYMITNMNPQPNYSTTRLSMTSFDDNYVFTSILLISCFGIELEQRTQIGKALSAPLASMVLSATFANVGIIPFDSSIYSFVNKRLVPLAVPMLLFDSDIKRVIRDTGSLLRCFFVGAISTFIATLATYPLIPMKSIGIANEGWKVASALAARHIGGAINFIAVAETLNISSETISASIAADNVAVSLYFALLFFLAKAGDNTFVSGNTSSYDDESDAITLSSIGWSFSISSSLVLLGSIMTKKMFPGTSSLPMISIISVFAATIFPGFFRRITKTGTALGVLFMQMFLASTGAASSIALVVKNAPTVFLFSLMQIGIHFVSLLSFGNLLLGEDKNELYLASNANVGGPTTAAAMAQAKNWPNLVLPALLIGILGYSVGTPIALGTAQLLQLMPTLS